MEAHKHMLELIHYRAEVVEQDSNQLRLVLYGVLEQLQDDSNELSNADIAYRHLKETASEAVDE